MVDTLYSIVDTPKMSALHVHGACSCTVVYLGGSYASGALSAFVRVSRHKTLCMYHLSHCFLLVFVFCQINIFSSSSSSSIEQYLYHQQWDIYARWRLKLIKRVFMIIFPWRTSYDDDTAYFFALNIKRSIVVATVDVQSGIEIYVENIANVFI